MTRTCKSIIDSLTKLVAERNPVSPHQFLEAAQYLATLMGDEHGKMYELEQAYIKKAMEEMEKGATNAAAEKKAKLTEEYLAYMKQKAFVNQISEFIRLAKKHAQLASEEMFAQKLT